MDEQINPTPDAIERPAFDEVPDELTALDLSILTAGGFLLALFVGLILYFALEFLISI